MKKNPSFYAQATARQLFRYILPVLVLANLAVSKQTFGKVSYPSTQRLVPGTVTVGSTITNTDQFYTSLYGSYSFTEIDNDVTLAIDNSITAYMPDTFSCKVRVRVYYKDHAASTLDSFDKYLMVTYNRKQGYQHQDKQVLHVHGGHYLKVKIMGISRTAVAPYLYLESSITDTYFGSYSASSHPVISSVNLNAKNDLVINWNVQDSAEEYDLEWTFVDDYDTGYGAYKPTVLLPYSFEDNATRVTVKTNSYKVTNIFEHGYVLFRVRGVSRDMVAYTQRINGAWSSATYALTPTVSAYPTTASYHVTSPHQPTFNWQYSATYAEEGKKKEVVTYLDGAYMSRQMVTKVNTDSLAIVGETIYDHQGRGAVQVLPVPDTLGVLKYHLNFNNSRSGGLYSRLDFDLDGGSCANNIAAMDTIAGAGNYYSTNNRLPHGIAGLHNYFHNYVPTADGYPFTLTEYTADNTGRIRRQSGVGYDMRMNSGRETKYFYGVPSQEEMDRLFGSSVGFARHYKKNMVQDANGQVSVSYLNASGKVVATALAGDTTTGLKQLGENTGATTVTENLLNGIVVNNRPEDALNISRSFLVSANNTAYTIDYRVNDSAFKSSCLPTGICYECVYDLTISLQDGCGNELLHGNRHSVNPTPLVRTIGKLHADFDTTCPGTPVSYKFSTDSILSLGADTDFIVHLDIGSYTITKKLSINTQAIDFYTNKYVKENTCIRNLQSFVDEKISHTDFSQCSYDCASCRTNLGTKSNYRIQWMANLTASGFTSLYHADTVRADARYDSLLNHCNIFCRPKDPCTAGYGMLRADVSPGGQYALFDTVTISHKSYFKWHNDSHTDMLDTTAGSNFRTLVHDTAFVDGRRRSVASMTVDQFVRSWKEEWADALIPAHPEYCNYHWCELNSASNYYDDSMRNTQSFDTAYARGYFSPLSHDPYFKNGGKGRSQWDTMYNILDDYSQFGGAETGPGNYNLYAHDNIISLQEFVIGYIFCGKTTNVDSFKACADGKSWTSVSCSPYKDAAWQMYRGMYMSQKMQLMNNHMHDSLSCNPVISGRVQRFPHDAGFLSAAAHPVDEEASHGLHNKNQTVQDFIAQGDSTCKAYADYWMQKLAGCHLSSTDSTNIRHALIAVCDSGVSPTSPFGSSSSQPGRFGSYSSFAQVLAAYGVYAPGICDANLITMPQPYNHDYADKQSPFANTCSCTKTQILNDSLCGQVITYDLISQTVNNSSVKNPVTGNTDCACKKSKTDSVSLMVNLLRTNIPDSMKCSHCITCDSIHHAMNSFYAYYNTGVIDTSKNFKTVFSNYLNGYFSFNLSYQGYLNYMAKCAQVSPDSAYQAFKLLYDTSVPPMAGDPPLMEPSFSRSSFSRLTPMAPVYQPGYSLMDTCACKKIFQIYKDSVNQVGTSFTMAQIFANHYPGSTFPEINARLKDCHYFLNKDSSPKKHWSVYTPWKQSSYYALTKTVAEKNIEVPDSLLCPTVIGGGGGGGSSHGRVDTNHYHHCDTVKFSCISVNEYIDSFRARHPANLNYDSIKMFEDSLNHHFLPHGCDFVPLTDFLKFADGCGRGGSPGCIPGKNYTCSYRPTPLLHQLGMFLEEMAADTTFINDSLPLQTYVTFVSPLYTGPCMSSTYKKVKYIDDFMIDMELVDGCGFDADLQLSLPDPSLNMDEIKAFHNIRVEGYGSTHTDISLFEIDATFRRFGLADTTVTLTGYSATMVFGKFSTCDKLCNQPLTPKITLPDSSCQKFLTNAAAQNAQIAYNDYIDSVRRAFRTNYTAKCLKAYKQEKFTVSHPQNEYHFTLYYYDQGGNLVQTVPPQGVAFITRQSALDSIDSARVHVALPTIFPAHTLATRYNFNTLNQLVWQHTPDADSSRFWYDRVGRLVVSRNRQQSADGNFSYTKFDPLGRITEVGQTQTISPISYALVRDDTRLNTWLAFGTHTQITRTYYDAIKYTILYKDFTQDNLRSRVASTTYQEVDGTAYDYGSHYSYDIHGNVYALVQQNTTLAAMGQNYKLINYDYDLVSGKVNEVSYEKAENDAFYHKYYYDADNRLTQVMTSPDNIIWDEDASYFYYYHGPLGRMELGDNKVQGVDYAYTIEGWIKGVNSDMIREKRDIGRDGDISLGGNINSTVARDAFGYSLSYFSGDYKQINGSAPRFAALDAGSQLNTASHNLFNGNIRNMVTAIRPLMTNANPARDGAMARSFQYDQLNRLVNVQAYNNLDTGSLVWKNSGNADPYYHEHFEYDQNGNILKANRRGDTVHSSIASMDSLQYKYYYGTNKLKQVTDAIDTGWYKTDIDNETDSLNYAYDKIGNLIADKANQISSITWTVYGKIKSVVRTSGSSKANLYFSYGPDGNRTMKLVKTGTKTTYHYYVRDAQGNVMAMYRRQMLVASTTIKDSMTLSEQDIYGSSRLGMRKAERLVQRFNYTGSLDTVSGKPTVTTTLLDTAVHYNDSLFSRNLGKKRYELSNHLGNVLATVSDRKLQHSTNTTTKDYYLPDVITAEDYYAFGAPMPGRTFSVDSMKVAKDTCVTCGQLKTAILGYHGSLLDSSALKAHLDSGFAAFHQSGATWLASLRTCRLMKEYFNFNESYNYFDHGSHSQYNFGKGDITYEAWVRISDSSAKPNKIIMTTSSYPSGLGVTGFTLGLYHKQPFIEVADIDKDVAILANTYISLNAWHHIVGVRIGNTYTNWKIYVDGNAVSTSHRSGYDLTLNTGNTDTLNNGELRIGDDKPAYPTANPYAGDMMQVRAYNRAISGTEVSASYNSGCGAGPSNSSGLVLWAPLNETNGVLTDHDQSSYNNPGSYSGHDGFTNTDWFRVLDTTCFTSASQHVLCNVYYVQAGSSYLYAFNGKEKDDETYGEGDEYDYGMRIYDARLGRFVSIDPLTTKYAMLTPYQFASNAPIWGIDQDGKELKIVTRYWDQTQDGKGTINKTTVQMLKPSGWTTLNKNNVASAETIVLDIYPHSSSTSYLFEPINGSNGMKPSAAYDYTNISNEKGDEDREYIANGVSSGNFNNSLLRTGDILNRDANAPDAQMSDQNFQDATLAISVIPIPMSWESKLGKTWGHTFTEHGEKRSITSLADRARSLGKPIGRWTNNEKAGEFIKNELKLRPFKENEAFREIEIPEGLGEVVNADGSVTKATHATITPGTNSQDGYVKTAYPIKK